MRKHNKLIILLLILLITLISCNTTKKYNPKDFIIMSSEPMANVYLSSYPTIKNIYESDDQIVVVVGWGITDKSTQHTLTISLVDKYNKLLFEKSIEDVTMRHYSFYYFPIPLNMIKLNNKLVGPLTVNLRIDDYLCKSQSINFDVKRIHNQNIDSIAIIPFIGSSSKSEAYIPVDEIMPHILNSSAHALFCEVIRIAPNTIPHFVSEQNIGKRISLDCFNRPECISYLNNILDSNIFLIGEIKIDTDYQNYGGFSSLMVYTYNVNTGKTLQFQSKSSLWKTGSIETLLKELLFKMTYETELLDYLKTCNENISSLSYQK